MNQLILGDNLEIMLKMESESIDLIYLDPPFFSNRNYEVIWGDKGEVRSFEDRWSGGIEHYIAWLKERVVEMYRLLKPTGSIYLHCDWHANSHIRVYILDKLFGEQNYINEVIWRRSFAHADSKQGSKHFGRCTDHILIYSKSDKYMFNPQHTEYSDKALVRDYKYFDEKKNRRYRLAPVDGPGGASKGNPYYEFLGVSGFWRFKKEKMQELYDKGRIVKSKTGKSLSQIMYLDEGKGRQVDNLWDDINRISPNSSERIGYPTQKPEKLLERIIQASSNEGDIVLDPFVGGGTTVVMADKLNRKWIGIDQSVAAIKVSEMRLNKIQNMFSLPFSVHLHKYDYDKLFNQNSKEFEIWIIEMFNGRPNIKKGGDKGIDGKMIDGTPIQVNQSENVGSMPIRQLVTDAKASDRNLFDKNIAEAKPIAFFIAFSYGRGAIQEVARLKNEENIIIKLVTVEEIVPIAKKPKMIINLSDKESDIKGLREIEFYAKAESQAGIEFYAFDFDYNQETNIFSAELMLNKDGIASYKFKPGTHTIAVKAIDNEGLEAIEVIKIKVNGVLEREL